jgi:2-phospho-L-lactate guanylyltransferase
MFVIIPAKPFAQSKTRLSPVLSLAGRIELSQGLLQRTVNLARQIGEVVVISRDGAVRQLAKQAGAWALVESGDNLNQALHQAATWVMMHGGQSILVLPADLPRLQLSDLKAMVEAGQSRPVALIGPCHRLEGTNALLLRPPDLIPFTFGPGSFASHQQAIRAVGLEPVIYRSPTVAFDLDLPEDLQRLKDEPVTGSSQFTMSRHNSGQ